jgi:hypothetical protein
MGSGGQTESDYFGPGQLDGKSVEDEPGRSARAAPKRNPRTEGSQHGQDNRRHVPDQAGGRARGRTSRQDYGLDRSDIYIQPKGSENSAGVTPTGADVESGHPGMEKHGDPALGGALEVSVDMNEDETDAVMTSFRDAGATDVITR